MEDSNKPLITGIILSGLINIALLSHVPEMQRPVTAIPLPKKEDRVLFDLRALPKKETYIDTPSVERKPEAKTEYISDKSSMADSSKKGTETGILPESKIKDIMPQAVRFAPGKSAAPPAMMIRKMEQQFKKMEQEQKKEDAKNALDKKTSIIQKQKKEELPKEKEYDLDEEISKISDAQVLLTKEQQPQQGKEDLFPLPMISIGAKNLSVNGMDSFNATGSKVGQYIKKMRDKIGLRFNEMVFFHFKSNSIVESRAKISFDIRPDGRVVNLKKEFISGENFFADYCESVIRNAEPFATFSKDMAPFLEDGVLKMNILFGYNVREKQGE